MENVVESLFCHEWLSYSLFSRDKGSCRKKREMKTKKIIAKALCNIKIRFVE